MTTAESLAQLFKDNFVVYYRSHVAHVNVTGRNFRSDHKLLQGIYERRQEQIDRIAEILRSMQEFMPADLMDVVETSTVYSGAIEGSADELLEQVQEDLENLLASYKELIVTAADEDLEEISNYAQDQALDIEKSLWMLRSTLE
jgi:DNA-binding ferritin-like protein